MKPICCPLNLNFCIETSRPRTKASRTREFRAAWSFAKSAILVGVSPVSLR
jgi:hypothetical protein